MISQRAPVERVPASTSAVDVLDHVLDKGIVIDAWMRVFLLGINLITVEAQIIVASIETYQQHFDPKVQKSVERREAASGTEFARYGQRTA
ncbi:MAG: hypothetical protein DMD91_08225 [Candidatus Rokuibacteriota bacterium]|nr:MAG: hypothetical protein DMD91_08225 [Candidatus Rokubacteria bacterium]